MISPSLSAKLQSLTTEVVAMGNKAAKLTNIRIICTDANLIYNTEIDAMMTANPKKHNHGFLA